MNISQFFQDMAAVYIEKWLTINNDDEFVARVYFTIRDIHTVIKNQDVPSTTQTNHYVGGKRAEKGPRFDKII